VRLRFYAPFITQLEICKDNGYDYQISNWKGLLELSQSDALLPNVVSLDLTNPWWCAQTQRVQLPLMLLFISPSLLEYRITSELKQHTPAISKDRCMAILHALQQRCPKLHTLALFTYPDLDYSYDERTLVPKDYEVSAFFKAASLRTLSTSLPMIDDIGNISLFSSVEQLNIHYRQSCDSFHALTVPGVEWPNLYQLSIYSLHNVERLNYLWAVPALASRLTVIRLQFRDPCFPSNTIMRYLEQLATGLAEGAPNLKSLWLVRRGTRGSFENPGVVVHMLSKLKLQDLHIVSQRDEMPGSVNLRQNLEGRRFNSIEHLEVGQHLVDLPDLQFYARSMPELKKLRLQVKIPTEDMQGDSADLPTSLHNFQLHVVNVFFDETATESAWESSSRYVLNG
jgi:hypothetical protein